MVSVLAHCQFVFYFEFIDKTGGDWVLVMKPLFVIFLLDCVQVVNFFEEERPHIVADEAVKYMVNLTYHIK